MPHTLLLNDPLYGSIVIGSTVLRRRIDHPYMQRLRRIRQLGMMEYVYPSATHTRFQHSIGTMHVMRCVLEQLRRKGHRIEDDEYAAAVQAALLHDIGHGPLSHTLEASLLVGTTHEDMGDALLARLEAQTGDSLALTREMLTGTYARPFFHALLHGQLDVDRLDYLHRDSFFTGISEGVLGLSRLIHTLTLHQDTLVLEEKAMYSLENFFHAHRLMYLQGYFHKTTWAVDQMLQQVFARARTLCRQGVALWAGPSLLPFLRETLTKADIIASPHYIDTFACLDDHDIWAALKAWATHTDQVLATLAQNLLHRDLFQVMPHRSKEACEKFIHTMREKAKTYLSLGKKEVSYLVGGGKVSYAPWQKHEKGIRIYGKDARVYDTTTMCTRYGIHTPRKPITQWYTYYPKALTLK